MENLVVMEDSLLRKKYEGKKVFLTGHTGFKGSWMILLLSELGANIRGFSLDPMEINSHYNLIKGNEKCTSVIGDIRDKETLKSEILEFKPDFVFHLAAQPLVRDSYERPLETYEVNVLGTLNLLEAVRELASPCEIVIVTTDKVYQNNEWNYPYREQDRLGGYDPYSSSKACVELLVDSYRNSFFNSKNIKEHGKSLATARAGNVIGGGDWSKDRLLPDIVGSLKENEQIIIRNPESVRPWQHVLDPIYAYLLLGARLQDDPIKFGRAWNFGPSVEDSMRVVELTNLSIQLWGKGSFKIIDSSQMHHEAGLLKLDVSDTSEHLLWKPRYDSVLSVQKTIEWYKNFVEYGEVISINQMKEFLYDH